MNAELEICYRITPQKEGVMEGVRICVKCGSPKTSILKDAIYCRDCRNFQLFTKKIKCRIYNTGTTLDLDKNELKIENNNFYFCCGIMIVSNQNLIKIKIPLLCPKCEQEMVLVQCQPTVEGQKFMQWHCCKNCQFAEQVNDFKSRVLTV